MQVNFHWWDSWSPRFRPFFRTCRILRTKLALFSVSGLRTDWVFFALRWNFVSCFQYPDTHLENLLSPRSETSAILPASQRAERDIGILFITTYFVLLDRLLYNASPVQPIRRCVGRKNKCIVIKADDASDDKTNFFGQLTENPTHIIFIVYLSEAAKFFSFCNVRIEFTRFL